MPTDAPARIHEVVDAVVLELNARIAGKLEDGTSVTPRFTATDEFTVQMPNPTLRDWQVNVRCSATASDEESRGGSEEQYTIEIVAQKAVEKTDKEEIKLLIDLVNRICRLYYVNRTIGQNGDSGEPGTTYGEVEPNTVQVIGNSRLVYDPAQLDKGRFFSIVSVTFREFRSR